MVSSFPYFGCEILREVISYAHTSTTYRAIGLCRAKPGALLCPRASLEVTPFIRPFNHAVRHCTTATRSCVRHHTSATPDGVQHAHHKDAAASSCPTQFLRRGGWKRSSTLVQYRPFSLQPSVLCDVLSRQESRFGAHKTPTWVGPSRCWICEKLQATSAYCMLTEASGDTQTSPACCEASCGLLLALSPRKGLVPLPSSSSRHYPVPLPLLPRGKHLHHGEASSPRETESGSCGNMRAVA